MKKFIKYMLSPINNDSRNKRELSVVKELGFDITVIDRGYGESLRNIDGYKVNRREKRISKNNYFRKLQILYSWLVTEPIYLKKQGAFCISCHDLIALMIGWLSTLLLPRDKKPLLVYDSHEFEIGRNTGGKRSKFAGYIILKVERFLIKKCAFSIMVNDSIADEVQRIHKLREKPLVVRNIPNKWVLDDSVCEIKRNYICEKLGITIDGFIVMYHGIITHGRGIETILESVSRNDKVSAVILGNGEQSYLDSLKQMAIRLNISNRVLFHEAVPIKDLWQYVGAVDVGMVIHPNVSKSYYYGLPNKFFENIQSLTPMIGSNFPEISKIVKEYDIGLLVNPENIDAVTSSIEEMRTNKDLYYRFRNNLKKAKEELCWENERMVLKAAYEKVLR